MADEPAKQVRGGVESGGVGGPVSFLSSNRLRSGAREGPQVHVLGTYTKTSM